MKRWTLQRKLTAVVVGIVSALLIVVAVLTAATLRTVLEEQLSANTSEASDRAKPWIDKAVDSGAQTAGDVLEYDSGKKGPRRNVVPGMLLLLNLNQGLSGAYLDEDGDVVRLTPTQLIAIPASMPAGSLVDIDIPDLGAYRAVADHYGAGAVIIAVPRADVDKTIGLLLATLSLLTVGGLVLLALAIGVTIRTSLRPLRAVAATAQRVASQPLEKGSVAITDRVHAEHVDEHTEIGQVGQAINTMLDHVDASLQARAANEEKMRQFVADASHELRTPLASIRGYSELSLRHPDNIETTTASLERIQAQSLRMTRLVEDLLLLARLDEGQELVLGQVDLIPLTIEALADAQMAGQEHSWEWDSDLTEAVVLGDSGRLHQVIANLLANARTHTDAGTHVILSVSRDGADVLVTVHDNGVGIEPAVRDSLFERFSRADRSRARKTGGTGLGLSIASAIAVAHHGSLAVESEPGSTVFTLRIPARPEVPPMPDASIDDAGQSVPAPIPPSADQP